MEQHSTSQWLHCPGGGTPRALPALQPGFERRCSRIKTPHQLLWKLQETITCTSFFFNVGTLWCTGLPCIFFLQRGWEGRKPPDKNKFCSRSPAACVSPSRSPLFPIIAFSSSHRLSAQQLFGLLGYLCFFSPLLHIFCICGKGHQLNVQIAFTYACQHFSERPPPPACVIAYFADGRFPAINSSYCICRNY